MGIESKLNRIGIAFDNEIEEIKKQRVDKGIDKKKRSTRKLTNLIIKHRDWKDIKKDLIELNLDKENEKP